MRQLKVELFLNDPISVSKHGDETGTTFSTTKGVKALSYGSYDVIFGCGSKSHTHISYI